MMTAKISFNLAVTILDVVVMMPRCMRANHTPMFPVVAAVVIDHFFVPTAMTEFVATIMTEITEVVAMAVTEITEVVATAVTEITESGVTVITYLAATGMTPMTYLAATGMTPISDTVINLLVAMVREFKRRTPPWGMSPNRRIGVRLEQSPTHKNQREAHYLSNFLHNLSPIKRFENTIYDIYELLTNVRK
jgi:hypothetical protein